MVAVKSGPKFKMSSSKCEPRFRCFTVLPRSDADCRLLVNDDELNKNEVFWAAVWPQNCGQKLPNVAQNGPNYFGRTDATRLRRGSKESCCSQCDKISLNWATFNAKNLVTLRVGHGETMMTST